MSAVGFEITISAGERPQAYSLHRAAMGSIFACCTNQINTTLVACDSWELEDERERAREALVVREDWECYSITTQIYS
jgi:hypothetical protein